MIDPDGVEPAADPSDPASPTGRATAVGDRPAALTAPGTPGESSGPSTPRTTIAPGTPSAPGTPITPGTPSAPRPRPTRTELLAAYGRTVPDLIAPDTRVLICGINPSLESGATGFHFGTPSNRLWPVLHLAGFTPRRLHPSETGELTSRGIGITNLVHRSTARADEITDDEVRAGVPRLTEPVERIEPRWVAFLGLSAYRVGFSRRRAKVGRQEETLGPAGIWLLPNPSGLNAHYQLPDLVRVYGELHEAAYH